MVEIKNLIEGILDRAEERISELKLYSNYLANGTERQGNKEFDRDIGRTKKKSKDVINIKGQFLKHDWKRNALGV